MSVDSLKLDIWCGAEAVWVDVELPGRKLETLKLGATDHSDFRVVARPLYHNLMTVLGDPAAAAEDLTQ